MFRTEETVDILYFGQKKPSTFYVSDRRNRQHFMFRTEEAVDILCFGQKKPSTFYTSDRRNRRHFIFRREETVEKFMFQKVKPVEVLFLGQKKPQKSYFSTISQDWIAKWSKFLVIPVVFPWIRWAITERFQFNLVIHFNMPLPWTESTHTWSGVAKLTAIISGTHNRNHSKNTRVSFVIILLITSHLCLFLLLTALVS